MIIAETLKRLISYDATALTKMIQAAGYKKDSFTGAKFLGISNGGQFVYFCTYNVEGGTDSTKVYVTYNPTEGRVSVDY